VLEVDMMRCIYAIFVVVPLVGMLVVLQGCRATEQPEVANQNAGVGVVESTQPVVPAPVAIGRVSDVAGDNAFVVLELMPGVTVHPGAILSVRRGDQETARLRTTDKVQGNLMIADVVRDRPRTNDVIVQLIGGDSEAEPAPTPEPAVATGPATPAEVEEEDVLFGADPEEDAADPPFAADPEEEPGVDAEEVSEEEPFGAGLEADADEAPFGEGLEADADDGDDDAPFEF